jgi:hypothetical protein
VPALCSPVVYLLLVLVLVLVVRAFDTSRAFNAGSVSLFLSLPSLSIQCQSIANQVTDPMSIRTFLLFRFVGGQLSKSIVS